MDLITGLPESKDFNTIFTIYYRLLKYRLYVLVSNKNKGISAKSLAKVLLREVYKYYGLSTLIVFNRGIQFVSAFWKYFYKKLGIKAIYSIAYHPKTNGQIERVNQDIKTKLRVYCNER